MSWGLGRFLDQSFIFPWFCDFQWTQCLTWIESISTLQTFPHAVFQSDHHWIFSVVFVTFVWENFVWVDLFPCNPVVNPAINCVFVWLKLIQKLVLRNFFGLSGNRVVFIDLIRSEVADELSLVWSKHYWSHQSEHPTWLDEILNINFRREPIHHLIVCLALLLPLFVEIKLLAATAKVHHNFGQRSSPKRKIVRFTTIDDSLYIILWWTFFWVFIDVIAFLSLVEDCRQWSFIRKLLVSTYDGRYYERY